MGQRVLISEIIAEVTDGDSVEQAIRENRCLRPKMGCGLPIKGWPHPDYRGFYIETGYCPSCYDQLEIRAEQFLKQPGLYAGPGGLDSTQG